MTQHGPGPIIHGQDVTNPDRYIIQYNGGPPQLLTPTEIALLPIRHQWFSGTITGLIASWWSREVAEQQAAQRGTLLGQIIPIRVVDIPDMGDDDHVVILGDARGRPLRGAL